MIEIIVTRDGLTDRAEADTAENALCAARTLFNEAWDRCPTQGAMKAITTVILIDGKHFRTIIGRP